MPGSAVLKRPWRSPRWSWCWRCVWPGSVRCQCNCAASMPLARRPGWPRVATLARPCRSLERLRRRPRGFGCEETVNWCSSRWLHVQSYCRNWLYPLRRSPSRSRDDRGSATLLAASMIAVLLCIAGTGVYLGAAMVARHRAQTTADLAALAGAARLSYGAAQACARAAAVARAMRVGDVGCVVRELDVVVTVEVPIGIAGAARAVARAGPIDTPEGGHPIHRQ